MIWLIFSLASALFVSVKNILTRKLVLVTSRYVVLYSGFLITFVFAALTLIITGIPEIDPVFIPAVLGSSIIDVIAVGSLVMAFSLGEVSETYPLVSFTPAFLLGTSFLILGEVPSILGGLGVLIIAIGSYILKIAGVKGGLLKPFRLLVKDRGPRFMILAAVMFSFIGPLFKLAIVNSSPYFTLAVSQLLSSLYLTVYFLFRGKLKIVFKALRRHIKLILSSGLLVYLQAIALFIAIELTLVAYAVSVKRTSILFTVIMGSLIYHEKNIWKNLAAGMIMLAGVVIIGFS